MGTRKISIVIPIFNESCTLPELWLRLGNTLSQLTLQAEVIFVDDGSTDSSPQILRGLCKDDSRVRLIRLSRNFGHQPAVTAGLDAATGDAVVLMDGDLQDVPEAIPSFVAEWQRGHEVVYAIRASRQENVIMRIAFNIFYRLLARMSGIQQPLDAGLFCLIDRQVAQILVRMPEHNRYLPGLRAYVGFNQKGVPVERALRHTGRSKVKLLGLLKLAADAIFSFSLIPIRMATVLGGLTATLSFLYLLIVAYYRIFTVKAITGWASTLGAVLLIGGLQLVLLGVVGEYIARIYEETKQRPYYVVAERHNFSPPT